MTTPAESDVQQTASRKQEREIDKLFRSLVKLKGSDLHIRVDSPPFVRVGGELRSLNRPAVDREEMDRLVLPLFTERARRMLSEEGGCDFAYALDIDGSKWRFRINAMMQMGHLGIVARRVNNSIPNFESLHLPPILAEFCKFSQGMVLLAGATGCGKSTTIASMLDWINHRYRKHILTLEDPIEFTFTEDKCLITQRELGEDVKDFLVGMKQAVREDPDIILVGEMRDRETFETAMRAAETGHLVFGTIHSSSGPTTIGRILDLFPQDLHSSIRSNIAFNMKAIITQKLIPSIKQGVERVPVCEIMSFTPSVRKLVLEGSDEKLPDAIRLGRDEGMMDFNQNLRTLVEQDVVDRAAAYEVSPNPEALKMALKGIEVKESGMF